MMIPAEAKKCLKLDAAFREPARDQTIARKRPRPRYVRAVHVEDVIGLVGDIGYLGHRGLHPVRHLILTHAR